MATALELQLDEEHEAKYQALKSLQTRKLKSLMTSIAAKDKEIGSLKDNGGGNRRAQAIQELRKRIRYFETINDVVKEELQKTSDTTVPMMNKMIIDKIYLSGPKRFRPLSREELENKIFDLEKQARKKAAQTASANTSFEAKPAESDAKGPGWSSPGMGLSNSTAKLDDDGKFDGFTEEIERLSSAILARDSLIDTQGDDMRRLRTRNAQLVICEEEGEFQEREMDDLNSHAEVLQTCLGETERKLAETLHLSMRLQAELIEDRNTSENELIELRSTNDKCMKQNSQLLASIAGLELERVKQTSRVHESKQQHSSVESEIQTKSENIKTLEGLVGRLEEKLRVSEKNHALLSKELLQIELLKEALREKNIAIKELKRR
jgi:hypothetical protein